MRYALPLAALLASSALTGCGLAKATGIMKEPPPNTVVELKVDRQKAFGESETLIVPTMYVRLAYEGKAHAKNDGDGLRTVGRGNSGNTHIFAAYKVDGLDKALAQEIAKKAYEDFVGKLRGAGYKVLTYDDVKADLAGMSRYEADKNTGIAMENGQMIATPLDEMAIKPGMGGNVLAPYMSFGKSKLKTEGTLIIPHLTLVSPLAKTETWSSGAALELKPGMALSQGGVNVLTHKGGWGSAVMKKWVFGLSDNAGTIVETADNTPKVANALTKGMSLLTGYAGRGVKSKAYSMTIDRNGYRDAALKGLSMFSEEVAKVAAGARKSS